VAVAGELDLRTVGRLNTVLEDVASTDDVRRIVPDLTDLTFMDSLGIDALLRGRRLVDQRGVGYEITNTSDVIVRTPDLTGVWEHLSGSNHSAGNADAGGSRQSRTGQCVVEVERRALPVRSTSVPNPRA
jgi:anti-anti-sigma factor